jgi:hypothetical protein
MSEFKKELFAEQNDYTERWATAERGASGRCDDCKSTIPSGDLLMCVQLNEDRTAIAGLVIRCPHCKSARIRPIQDEVEEAPN